MCTHTPFRNAKCVFSTRYVCNFSHENQILTLGWSLSIRNYKYPPKKESSTMLFVLWCTDVVYHLFYGYVCMGFVYCLVGIEWYWLSLIWMMQNTHIICMEPSTKLLPVQKWIKPLLLLFFHFHRLLHIAYVNYYYVIKDAVQVSVVWSYC